MYRSPLNDQPLVAYRDVYGLAETDLISGPGADERGVVEEAARDYLFDRAGAFTIAADSCALIVIDMQAGFVSSHSPQWVPQAERMVPKLARFANTCRSLGLPVIFTSAQQIHPSPNDSLAFTTAMADGNLDEGASGVEIDPRLITAGDVIVTSKHTYDAFYDTDLESRIRAWRRDTIIVTGTLTNFCCEATARGGFDRGFHIVFCSDLTATDSALAQIATERTMRRGYARVLDAAALTEELSRTDQVTHQVGVDRDHAHRRAH